MGLIRRWLARLLPRPQITRPVTRTRHGAVVHTRAGLAVHFNFYTPPRAALPKPPNARATAKAPRRSRLADWLFGAPPPPPLADRDARRLPIPRDWRATQAAERQRTLDEVGRLTGHRYSGRQAVVAARAAQAPAPTQAKAPPRPVRVKAHTRADGAHVAAHTRAKPGEGST